MKNKKVLILSLVLGGVLLLSTAFASAASIWTISDGLIQKVLTVGTDSNNGKLNLKGSIRNPVKNKPVVINDDLKINGILKGTQVYESDGLIKASAEIASDGRVIKSFNKLSSQQITAINYSTGEFTINFGSDVSNKYIQITPYGITMYSGNTYIKSITGNSAYIHTLQGQGFFITVY